jgi:hypothetical protein
MEKYNNYLARNKIVAINYDKLDVNCAFSHYYVATIFLTQSNVQNYTLKQGTPNQYKVHMTSGGAHEKGHREAAI